MSFSEIFLSSVAFSSGLALGAAFHLGLWWTVTRGLGTGHSALWFPGSMLLRMGGTVAGFYLIGAGRWERFLACLAGFLLAQILVTRFAPRTVALAHPKRSADHAP